MYRIRHDRSNPRATTGAFGLMAWLFEQATGELYNADGELVATGYSGFGPGRNAPSWQDHSDVGPIPCGTYAIGEPECVDRPGPHGPFVLRLTPFAANQMFGRSGMLIHGDSKLHGGCASHGCVILPRAIRERIAESGDHFLQVEPGT
jgi:hypothetical protein